MEVIYMPKIKDIRKKLMDPICSYGYLYQNWSIRFKKGDILEIRKLKKNDLFAEVKRPKF